MFFSAEEEALKEEMKSKRYRLRSKKEALTRLGFKCFVGTLECLILTHTSVLVRTRIYESKRVVYKQRISVNESETVKQPLKKRLLAAAPPGSVAVVVVVVVVVFSQFFERVFVFVRHGAFGDRVSAFSFSLGSVVLSGNLFVSNDRVLSMQFWPGLLFGHLWGAV